MKVAQSCPTLCDPMNYIAWQASLATEFPRQEYWSGLPFPSSGDLPNPRTEPGSPALQADSVLSEPQGKPIDKKMNIIYETIIFSLQNLFLQQLFQTQ